MARAGVKQRLYYQNSRSSMSLASTTSQIIPHDTTMSFAMICHCNNKIKYKTNTSISKPRFKSYMHCHQKMMLVYSAFRVLEFRPLPSSKLKTRNIFTVRRPWLIKPTPLLTGPNRRALGYCSSYRSIQSAANIKGGG